MNTHVGLLVGQSIIISQMDAYNAPIKSLIFQKNFSLGNVWSRRYLCYPEVVSVKSSVMSKHKILK